MEKYLTKGEKAKINNKHRLLIFYFFYYIVLKSYLCVGQNLTAKISIDGNKNGNNEYCPMFMRFDESFKFKEPIFQESDSTFIFQFKNIDSLNLPYTYLVIYQKNREYQIPIDPLFRTAGMYDEFRNIRKIRIIIQNVRRMDKYYGVFTYQLNGEGVQMSNISFYYTKESFSYKNLLKQFLQYGKRY